MIPTTDLLRLLERLVSADYLREHPTHVREEWYLGSFSLDHDDVQSFATIARIAAGEVWEGFPNDDTVAVPAELLDAPMFAGASLHYSDHPQRSRRLRRLEQIARTAQQEASS